MEPVCVCWKDMRSWYDASGWMGSELLVVHMMGTLLSTVKLLD